MYKCNECENIFEESKIWTEPHGEEISGCPFCGGAFCKVVPCDVCKNYTNEDDLCDASYCVKCAEKAYSSYTDELGRAFVSQSLNTEKSFYLECLNGIRSCYDSIYLLDIIKTDPPIGYERELQEYCLGDYTEWVAFYYSSSAKTCSTAKQGSTTLKKWA